jgi:hypothetical protein
MFILLEMLARSDMDPWPVLVPLAYYFCRRQLSRFLIKAVCDQYQGNYNAHNLAGFGSALWMVDQFWNQPPVAVSALYQYLNFFFGDLKSKT